MSEVKKLTISEAIELVGGEREYIHCFMNPNGMLLGADWQWQRFLDEMETATRLAPAGPTAERMGHPLGVFSAGSWKFFEMNKP